MADPTALVHGEPIEVLCPEGSQVSQQPGFSYPSENPVFVVVAVDGNRALVGPTATGSFKGFLNCSDGSETDFRIELPHLDPQALPEKAPALGPADLRYPVWIWIALGLLVLALIGVGWKIRNVFREKKIQKAKKGKRPKKIRIPPAEALDRFLQESARATDGREMLSQGAARLRAYLEELLGFSGAADTTREFIASARSALLVQRELLASFPDAPVTIERLLLQADQIRFSGDAPDEAIRANFLGQLREIRAKLRPPASEASRPPLPTHKGSKR